MCVVEHNEGTGVDKDSYENVITITLNYITVHTGDLTLHLYQRFETYLYLSKRWHDCDISTLT